MRQCFLKSCLGQSKYVTDLGFAFFSFTFTYGQIQATGPCMAGGWFVGESGKESSLLKIWEWLESCLQAIIAVTALQSPQLLWHAWIRGKDLTGGLSTGRGPLSPLTCYHPRALLSATLGWDLAETRHALQRVKTPNVVDPPHPTPISAAELQWFRWTQPMKIRSTSQTVHKH